jgi:hypothetical protein
MVQFQDVADALPSKYHSTTIVNLRSQWHLDMLKMIATFSLKGKKNMISFSINYQ